jgi:HEAT repeat protein
MALFRRKKVLIPALVLLVLAAGMWWQRLTILSWYYVRHLAAAGADERDRWVQRTAGLDARVLPGLLSLLELDDERACGNAEAALTALLERWGPDDARALRLLDEVRERFGRCSSPGRRSALHVPIWLLRHGDQPSPELRSAAANLLHAAAHADEAGPSARVLALAAAFAERSSQGECPEICTDLARRGLAHADAAARVSAVNLGLQLARRFDAGWFEKVAPLLHDPAAEVRRAAILAVGSAPDVIADDDLLPYLHDADAEVRRLCELALRSRGLHENHILLARLISDERATARLQVLEHLRQAPELEPGVWLRRLTEDPDRAVRAAAIRAACKDFPVDLRERIRHMAQHDSSETVRHIAALYLNHSR